VVAGTDHPHVVRDGDGNALGGVRVPEMDAPLARHVAAMQETTGGLMGEWHPLDPEVIRARYPDHAAYEAAYGAAAQAAVGAGVLRARDAEEAIRHAKGVSLP
jgi:Alpha/beta hydrolase domain